MSYENRFFAGLSSANSMRQNRVGNGFVARGARRTQTSRDHSEDVFVGNVWASLWAEGSVLSVVVSRTARGAVRRVSASPSGPLHVYYKLALRLSIAADDP